MIISPRNAICFFAVDLTISIILDTLYFKNNKVYYRRTDIPEEEQGNLHIINNPTWRLLDNQYVATTIDIKGYDLYLVYIHRLLLGCQKTNNNIKSSNKLAFFIFVFKCKR